MVSLFLYADNRTRTCTVARWNLNPVRLPIPPYPLNIYLFYASPKEMSTNKYRLLRKASPYS